MHLISDFAFNTLEQKKFATAGTTWVHSDKEDVRINSQTNGYELLSRLYFKCTLEKDTYKSLLNDSNSVEISY